MVAQTKTTWREVKLGEIADINMGQSPQSQFYNLNREGLPFFQGVTEFKAMYPVIRQWTSKFTKVANAGDILFSVRAPVGRVNYAKEKVCIGRGLASMRAKAEYLDQTYLFYLLKNEENNFILQSGGSIYDSINKDKLNDFDINIPAISTQKQIAQILAIYDDLIYNNTRRIQILEQIARATYTEWFVNFRFPDHEKVKMIDSSTEFGKIPEGWEISKIGSVLDIKSGHTFKSKSYTVEGLYKIVTIKNIHDGKFVSDFNYIPEVPKNMPDHCRLNDGDILLSLTGNVGRVCIVYGENLLLNQRVGKIVPKDTLYRSFIYSIFRSDNFKKQLELLSNGVAQQNLSPVQTLDLKTVLPPVSLIADFNNLVSKLLNLMINLNKQNDSLSKSRDLLLPKLVTGEIEVKI